MITTFIYKYNRHFYCKQEKGKFYWYTSQHILVGVTKTANFFEVSTLLDKYLDDIMV